MRTILNRLSRVLLVSLSPLLLASPSPVRADIFQWEYINPADPSQGKQQSSTLAPDGAGIDAVPGANLAGRDLTQAYLIGANLQQANFGFVSQTTRLRNADLSESNLTSASFRLARLTGANFSKANLTNALW